MSVQFVSVSEMAKRVGLSRARFYQLIGTAFPWPLYELRSRRPFYSPELQVACLEVRRRNCGVDGNPVIFYAKRTCKPQRRPAKTRYTDLIEPIKGLGLAVCLECHGKVHDKNMLRMVELQRLGIEKARRNGKKWGGSKKGWRWRVTDDQVAAICEMKAAGKPVAQIARVTGLSRPTIYRVLESVRDMV